MAAVAASTWGGQGTQRPRWAAAPSKLGARAELASECACLPPRLDAPVCVCISEAALALHLRHPLDPHPLCRADETSEECPERRGQRNACSLVAQQMESRGAHPLAGAEARWVRAPPARSYWI